QITNFKSQTNSKCQISNSKRPRNQVCDLEFVTWDLFEICDLYFGISEFLNRRFLARARLHEVVQRADQAAEDGAGQVHRAPLGTAQAHVAAIAVDGDRPE